MIDFEKEARELVNEMMTSARATKASLRHEAAIAAALRTAYQSGIDDAAKVAEAHLCGEYTSLFDKCRSKIAAAIRALTP